VAGRKLLLKDLSKKSLLLLQVHIPGAASFHTAWASSIGPQQRRGYVVRVVLSQLVATLPLFLGLAAKAASDLPPDCKVQVWEVSARLIRSHGFANLDLKLIQKSLVSGF
jgi:hypothetical protein